MLAPNETLQQYPKTTRGINFKLLWLLLLILLFLKFDKKKEYKCIQAVKEQREWYQVLFFTSARGEN